MEDNRSRFVPGKSVLPTFPFADGKTGWRRAIMAASPSTTATTTIWVFLQFKCLHRPFRYSASISFFPFPAIPKRVSIYAGSSCCSVRHTFFLWASYRVNVIGSLVVVLSSIRAGESFQNLGVYRSASSFARPWRHRDTLWLARADWLSYTVPMLVSRGYFGNRGYFASSPGQVRK